MEETGNNYILYEVLLTSVLLIGFLDNFFTTLHKLHLKRFDGFSNVIDQIMEIQNDFPLHYFVCVLYNLHRHKCSPIHLTDINHRELVLVPF